MILQTAAAMPNIAARICHSRLDISGYLLSGREHLQCTGEVVIMDSELHKSEETPRLSTEHHPLGREGLWHTPDRHTPDKQQLPALMHIIRISLTPSCATG